MSKAPLALTMGDPAGVGCDVTLKAWAHHRHTLPAFVIIADPAHLSALAERLGLAVNICVVENPAEAEATFAQALPVLSHPLARPPTPGTADAANAQAVIGSIERAVELALAGKAAGIVTNPISKHVLHQAGFAHPGHTEFLAHLAGGGLRPVMMLAGPALRVVPVTVHTSLLDAVQSINVADIVEAGRITAAALAADFGIERPRLAVAGLNPHAGEQGTMGAEETTIIAPAIARLQGHGILATGPHPPDSLFTPARRATYDAALCMYHDQALIPVKTLDFSATVNVTLGLPLVRTSPDHGTAFDIAGTGKADEHNLIAALRMAHQMAGHRAKSARQ